VFLSEADAANISKSLDMTMDEFIKVYCRWVDWEDGDRLSLKEKSSLDCIFWDEGCLIYETRPIQCKTYPFWAYMLDSEEVWRFTTSDCPGAGTGNIVSGDYIESCAELDRSTHIITRQS
jgi:Fe-S-cluster containining protein